MPASRIHEVVVKELNKEYKLDEILFRIGAVAPDSWRNVQTDSGVKDKKLTHFWDFRIKNGQANDYEEFYLKYYNELNNPFYLGYLVHLITDQYWKTYIDPKYFFEVDGISLVKLLDGTFKEDKDWYSYYEDLKIQKQLCKVYQLSKLPTEKENIINFECDIDELNINGLFGETGTLSYINNKLTWSEDDIVSEMFDINVFKGYISDTVEFIKRELERLKKLKIEDDKKIKIAVDIDDTILCTKELEEYYWKEFLQINSSIDPNKKYVWGDPELITFWSEYREKMAFGEPKEYVSQVLDKLQSLGYRVDLLSARPLEKYASLKRKLVEHFENYDIKYNYMNLGFYSKKEFLKKREYDILIDNDMKHIEEAELVGVIPILYGPYNISYKGYQTSDWNEIPKIIENIIKKLEDSK